MHPRVPLGILPDQMHLVHLTIAPDAIVSSLLDWTDSEEYVSGNTREKRLAELWDHYRCFCEEAHIGDRASRKLFSVATLSPDSIGYVEVSQKKLSATAARYMLYWLSNVAKDYALTHAKDADMQLDPYIDFVFPHIFVWGSCFWFCTPAACLTHNLYSHTTYSHTTRPHTTYSHTTCPHKTYLHTTYSHTTCPHKTYLHTTYSHTTYSHTTYSHTTCPHTTCSHTTCPHTTYSHTTYSHTTYSHTTYLFSIHIYVYNERRCVLIFLLEIRTGIALYATMCKSNPSSFLGFIIRPRYRAGVASGLCEMETICLNGTRRLTEVEWQKLEEGYLCYRAAANHLADLAIAQGLPRWHTRPKCHYLEHAIYDFDRKNLRYMSNYLDEDMIRRVKRMALAANPRCVAKHVVYRYGVAATLRWSGMIR